MKFILALVASCLFSALVAGQTPAPTPPASGPSGPVGPAGPPPANLPPAGARQSKPGPTGPTGPSITLEPSPQKARALPAFDRWVNFDSPGGGFTIKFPAKPVSQAGAASPNAPGLLRYRTGLDAGAGRYLEVNYYDYQGHLNSPESAKTAGLNSMIAYAQARDMEVKARRKITNGRCQIEEATIGPKANGSFPLAMVMKVRVLYSADKVYILLGGGPHDVEIVKAVDYFLDSFAVTGGCVDAIGSQNIRTTKGKAEGTLDTATGWYRFETSYGISFLLPTGAVTENWEDDALGKNFTKFMYLSSINGVTLTVEIANNFVSTESTATARADTVLDATEVQLRENIAKFGYVLGACTPQMLGSVRGRECTVTRTPTGPTDTIPEKRGRTRILVTPKWTFVLMALREAETTDPSAENRFFKSVTIDPK